MPTSTFALRFEFSRLFESLHVRRESDKEFAKAIGVVPGSVTGYKTAADPPPTDRVLLIAQRCGVDPGWLAFGSESAAPAPEGFTGWLGRSQQIPLIPVEAFQRVDTKRRKS